MGKARDLAAVVSAASIADYVKSADSFGARITNNSDSSQGLQVRTSDNDTGQYILDLQSSSSATGTDYASKLVVEKGGNCGIGTSSPSEVLHLEGASVSGGENYIHMRKTDQGSGQGIFIGQTTTSNNLRIMNHANNDITFHTTTSDTERMRILSGGDIIIDGTSTVLDGRITENFAGNARRGMTLNDTTSTNTANFLAFAKGGSEIGRVQKNSGADTVNYSTTSDYRLKENEENISDGITRVKQLKPYKFNWKSYPEANKVDGFFAHEVQAVVPEAVNGEKDAVDDNDNIKPQGIDQSKLVPLLTAALQEAIAEIDILKTKVAALEAD